MDEVENPEDSRVTRLPDNATTVAADDIIMNHNEPITTTNGQTTEPALLQLTDVPTTNESTSDFDQSIDALLRQLDKFEERASRTLLEAAEKDPWNPLVPLVPVEDCPGSGFEDGDFGTLNAEQFLSLEKVEMEAEQKGMETDSFVNWIRSSSSSQQTNSGTTGSSSDEDLINLDDEVNTYVRLEQENDNAIVDEPLEEKIEQVEVFAGVSLAKAAEPAFVDVPLEKKIEQVEAFAVVPLGQAFEDPFVDDPPLIEMTEEEGVEFEEDGESETKNDDVYEVQDLIFELDNHMEGDFNAESDFTLPQAYEIVKREYRQRHEDYLMVKEMFRQKLLHASMEKEEGQSLKSKSVSADEDAEELLENISYEVAAAVLDPEDVEITPDNLEPQQRSAATTNSPSEEAKQELKFSESASQEDQIEPKPAIRKKRSQKKTKLSVTFAPKIATVIHVQPEPKKKAASSGERQSPVANVGKNRGNPKSKPKETNIISKEEEPTKTNLGLVSAEPVESSAPPLEPSPMARGASTTVKSSYFKPTMYADFENPELARIVAKHRQKDLEAAEEDQNKSPPPMNASTPHPKKSYLKRWGNSADAARTSKSPYFLAAPPPLNNIYNVPKTGIQIWQENMEKRKKQIRSESATGAAVQVESGSQEQKSGIPSLMSLSVSPPPGSKAKNKSKKKSKAKGRQTEETESSSTVLESMEQDNAEIKNTSEAEVATRSLELLSKQRNQANFNYAPKSSAEKPAVWTGHPTSPPKNPMEQQARPTAASMVPKAPIPSPSTEARKKGFPEYDLGNIKEPIKILSSDELSDAMNSGREITYIDRVMFKNKIPRKSKGTKTFNLKSDGKRRLNSRLLEAFSSSSDSSLSESSSAKRSKQKPVGYEMSKIYQMAPDETKREVSTHSKAENKRVLQLRYSEVKMIKTDATETLQGPRSQGAIGKKEVQKIEGHKCLFRRCKAKIGTLSMNREDATVAMKDHLWRTHKVKIEKGEEQFVLSFNLEKLEKLRDSVKGTTEVLSLLKHWDFFFAVKVGVGPDDIFYYELVYLKNSNDVDVKEDIFVQQGFEIVNEEERDMELREIPVSVWDPVDPVRDNPYNVKSIPVAELKENFLFHDTISMGFRVFAISTGPKPSTSANLYEEEIEHEDMQIQETQYYVQRCKDTTFFGKPSFR